MQRGYGPELVRHERWSWLELTDVRRADALPRDRTRLYGTHAYQLDVLHHVRSLGMTVIAALHDLNLAGAWCDRIYVIADGAIVVGGLPRGSPAPEGDQPGLRRHGTPGSASGHGPALPDL